MEGGGGDGGGVRQQFTPHAQLFAALRQDVTRGLRYKQHPVRWLYPVPDSDSPERRKPTESDSGSGFTLDSQPARRGTVTFREDLNVIFT